jgi:hypothetical protein
MNRFAVVALLIGVGASAHASSERFYPMYDVSPGTLEKRAVEAAAKVAESCDYSMFSRIGPRPGEMARCNDAEQKLVSQGAAGARAAMAMLDDEHLGHGARGRMYDVIARVADTAFVEPLIVALEREDKAGMGNPRQYEKNNIVAALTAITYSEQKGTPAIQWRAWQDSHKGMTRDQLLAARATEVEQIVAKRTRDGDFDEVMSAARFLGTHQATRLRAKAIMESVLAREDLSYDQRKQVQMALARLPIAMPSAGKAVAQQGAPRS